jgi:nucleotide-binding universal stress UspA family protein
MHEHRQRTGRHERRFPDRRWRRRLAVIGAGAPLGGRAGTLTGQELHAVIAWEFPVTYGALPVPDGVDWAEDSRAILEKTVANALPEVEARQVVQHVVHGAPARAPVNVTEGADLLVVGCRGHGRSAGLLLGSVSQHVVTHASCPVLVVHEHADRD